MGKKELAAVSRTETEILRLLMQLGQGTVQQVCDALPPGREIGYATVQTLLRRLEKKGYIGHTVQGKAFIFYALVERDEVVRRSVRDFVNHLFGGDPVPLMLHLADHSKLTAKDIKRLKTLIDKPNTFTK
jgi:BlaI family transcriptional regulator, penicillinase repressor